MLRSLSKYLLFISALLLLVSCDQTVECIEPDDWGQQVKYTISGNNNSSYKVNPDHTEIGYWNNGGLILNGQNIIGVVKNSTALESNLSCNSIQSDCTAAHGGYCSDNTWTAWYGDWSLGKDGGLCQFNGGWCPPGVSMNDDIPVSVIPCLFSRGLGLYLAVSGDYTATLNPQNPFIGNEVCNQVNNNCYLHVGDTASNPQFYDNYCPANGFAIEPPDKCKDGTHQCGMGFKISDRYYADNKGQYTISFKQGVLSKSYTGPLSKFAQLVTGILCDATTSIYNRIVHESSFRNYVGVLLILFVALMGVSFLIGTSNMTHTELIIMTLKFGVITQLIMSDSSWTFFNDYFFSFFINGIGEITGILFGEASFAQNIGSTSGGQCAPNVSGIQAFDTAIAKLFSYETTRKIMSLMVWKIWGAIYILAVYVMILVIIFTIIKALLIFFVSFLAISILIVLAPIFLPFMLFGITRSFFENWLKQLVSHFIQPIIILTFAFFMMTMLMNQLEFLFGYRVCWKEWFKIPVIDLEFYAWQSDYNNNSRGCIPTPNSLYVEKQGNYTIATAGEANTCATLSAGYTGECTPYACSQNRYIGFPYLDPNDTIDKDRIHELQSNDLVSLIDLVIMFIMVWFMVKFNKVVPAIAKRLGGTLNSQTSVGDAGAKMAGKLGKFTGKAVGKVASETGYMLLSPAYGKITSGRSLRKDIKSLRGALTEATEKEQELSKAQNEHAGLISGLRKSAGSKTRSLAEKAKDVKRIKFLENRMLTLKQEIKAEKKEGNTPKGFFARAAKKGGELTGAAEGVARLPGKLPMKGLKKIGRKTVGRPLRPIRKFIKGKEDDDKDE